MKTIIVGDHHGKDDVFKKNFFKWKHQGVKRIIVLGDFGLGFPRRFDPPYLYPIPTYLLRGNHDDPNLFANLLTEGHEVQEDWNEANFFGIKDGTIEDGVLFLGGADSPWFDRRTRTPGYDWWPGEGLTWDILDRLDKDALNTVHTIVAHDCPTSWYPAYQIFEEMPGGVTGQVLDAIVANMVPNLKRYIHGHHHHDAEWEKGGIRVRCIPPIDHNYNPKFEEL